jgi:hypothetical protein
MVFLHLKGSFRKAAPLVSACRRSGITVHALIGGPKMALPVNHDEIPVFINRLTDYNSLCRSSERVSGIHIDVEPYLLDEYSAGSRDKVMRHYIDMLKRVNSHIQQIDSGLAVGADIPFWLDKKNSDGEYKLKLAVDGTARPVSEHVIDLTDYICIMAYRNYLQGSDGLINIAADEIRYASKVNKHVFVGVETGRGKGIPEKTTFAGKGRAALMSALKETEKAFSTERSFSGTAVHYYKTWRAFD